MKGEGHHYGKPGADFQIISFIRPSQQSGIQEQAVRSFSGWNDVLGRVKAPSAGLVLSKVSKYAPSLNASQNVQTLGNRPTASRIAIDFQRLSHAGDGAQVVVAHGNPGQATG